jgi:hypothetical protein
VCECEQAEGLLCHADTLALEIQLGDVSAVVEELNVTLAKMDRMGGGGSPGLARERWAYSPGASLAADYLVNTLTTWARDVVGETYWVDPTRHPAISASFLLLSNIPEIRRHPEAKELHEEILATVAQARAAADRPANRTIIFVGPCPELNDEGDYCDGEVYAYFPVEDSRPPKMECRTNKLHKWPAMQWLRAGKRILDRTEARKRREVA